MPALKFKQTANKAFFALSSNLSSWPL